MIEKTQKKMKTLVVTFSVLLIGIMSYSGCVGQQENVIKVSGANALQPMMEVWAAEYQKLYPHIKIDVSGGGAGKGMTDALAGVVDIGMVSRDVRADEISQGAFWISVATDAVVATMNAQNPVKDQLLARGVTQQQLEDIFTHVYSERTIQTWGRLIGDDTASTQRIWVYTRQDSCGAAEMWAKYLGNYKQDNISAAADTAIIEDPNLRAALQGDVNGIGYNNINTLYNIHTKLPYEGILAVPIDLNGNGVLDANESFYANSTAIINAIKNHVYPWPPARNLHLVTKNNFTGITKDFISWILKDGQQYVPTSGYIELPQTILEDQIVYLNAGTRPEIL